MYDREVISALREAVEQVEVPADGDALAAVFELIDRLCAKASAAVAEFDAAALWGLDGATSMTAWLRHRAGMTASTAKGVASTARKLASLPVTAEAWRAGVLSGGHVQAIVRNAPEEFDEAAWSPCWPSCPWPMPRT